VPIASPSMALSLRLQRRLCKQSFAMMDLQRFGGKMTGAD